MVDLRKLAEQLNIDDIAVCHAERFTDVEFLLKKDLELGILPPFTEKDIEKRVCPEKTLENAASFIVLLEHYEPKIYKRREGPFGNISPAACGEDYHRIVRRKLDLLMEALSLVDPEGKRLFFVDDSPFSEKHLAMRAGLGKIMKNGLFYSKKFGSRCFIGLILSDREPGFYGLPPRSDQEDTWFLRCNTCSACQKLCPGKALSENGMNSYRCAAYLTQKKEPLTPEEERIMGEQVYGCDICQKVCPLNPPVPAGYETGTEIALDDILSMTNKEFKLIFRQTAAGWRGKKQLQKNAEIILRNKMEKSYGNMEFQGTARI